MAGGWWASSTSTGGIWSSTPSTRRFARWVGCCWPSRRTIWPRTAAGFCERSARTRVCSPRCRWCEQPGVRHLRLVKLPVSGATTMVAEMLHVEPAAAAGLARLLGPHASGNPYETVELLNTLRHDGALTATAGGWRWDEAPVQTRQGRIEEGGL